MDKSERRNQEETYLWIPIQFLDQILKAFFKCLGLNSPATMKKASPQEAVEEEDVIFMEEDVVVSTRGIRNGVVVSARATKVKGKIVKKEKHSSGRGGQHN